MKIKVRVGVAWDRSERCYNAVGFSVSPDNLPDDRVLKSHAMDPLDTPVFLGYMTGEFEIPEEQEVEGR